MGGLFGGAPSVPDRSAELERERQAAAAEAAQRKADEEAKIEEARLQRQKGLRGARSLMSAGLTGFENKSGSATTLGDTQRG